MAKEKTAKQLYKEFKKKFQLPPFNQIDDAFEISLIDPEKFFLREIVRTIRDELDSYFKILDTVLQPDTKLGEMREANAFNEVAKQKIYDLYKRLRYHYRSADEVLINGSEDICAKFITSFFSQFPAIRKEMQGIIHEMKNVWQKEMKERTDLAYFG